MLAGLGGALEFYDFVIFVFLAPVISKLFMPPHMPEWLAWTGALGMFSAGYLFRPLGGIVLAQIGDLLGRKRIFIFSILLMATSTLGMALVPTHAAIGSLAPLLLVLLRIAQGAAIGGEIPGAWTYVAEQVPRRKVGFACGFLCSGLTLGILLGALLSVALGRWFSQDDILAYAWRIPFLVGGILGMFGVVLRRLIQETPVFTALRDHNLLVPELPLKVILAFHAKGILLCMAATWVLSAGVVVTTLMTPSLLEDVYGYPRDVALSATCFGTIFLFMGLTLAGMAADRMGIGRSLVAGAIVLAPATFLFYSFAGHSAEALYLLSAAMGLSVGVIGIVPFVMVSAFPSEVRFTGVSFAYNVSYAIYGGLTPVSIAALSSQSPMAQAYYLLFAAFLLLVLGIYILFEPNVVRHRPGIEDDCPPTSH